MKGKYVETGCIKQMGGVSTKYLLTNNNKISNQLFNQ